MILGFMSWLMVGWRGRGLGTMGRVLIGELEVVAIHSISFFTSQNTLVLMGCALWRDYLLAQTSMFSISGDRCWISNLEPFNGMWHLSEGIGIRNAKSGLLQGNSYPNPNAYGTGSLSLIHPEEYPGGGCELSSIWAPWEDPLPLGSASKHLKGAFVKGVMLLTVGPSFSTAAYGKTNKVPQENIPTATSRRR
ncbi:hypothetical protein CUMW_168640 [Citrus unshiu]|uniref:Uncharacterized protein n=1 Tax=Citrus unshiu TaxID=55188 RepID=A0A2H5PUI6_CITUN|nr:hypothetical protein CUMW_168640 [Citrus unshiu]